MGFFCCSCKCSDYLPAAAFCALAVACGVGAVELTTRACGLWAQAAAMGALAWLAASASTSGVVAALAMGAAGAATLSLAGNCHGALAFAALVALGTVWASDRVFFAFGRRTPVYGAAGWFALTVAAKALYGAEESAAGAHDDYTPHLTAAAMLMTLCSCRAFERDLTVAPAALALLWGAWYVRGLAAVGCVAAAAAVLLAMQLNSAGARVMGPHGGESRRAWAMLLASGTTALSYAVQDLDSAKYLWATFLGALAPVAAASLCTLGVLAWRPSGSRSHVHMWLDFGLLAAFMSVPVVALTVRFGLCCKARALLGLPATALVFPADAACPPLLAGAALAAMLWAYAVAARAHTANYPLWAYMLADAHTQGLPHSHWMALAVLGGPSKGTADVLDALAEHEEVSATFFVTADLALRHTEVVERCVLEGHQVAVTFPDSQGVPLLATVAYLERELSRAVLTIEEITGVDVEWFMPPADGQLDPRLLLACRRVGLKVALWSALAPFDVAPEAAVERAMSTVGDGGDVVLVHDSLPRCGALPNVAEVVEGIVTAADEREIGLNTYDWTVTSPPPLSLDGDAGGLDDADLFVVLGGSDYGSDDSDDSDGDDESEDESEEEDDE